MATENTNLNNLLQIQDSNAFIKESTCYQPQNPNCIDKFLAKRKKVIKTLLNFLNWSLRPWQTNFNDNETRCF